jgi:hypothetical protein
MLKQFKVITLAPKCFGSLRNHHQGAVLCLVKTTDMFFFLRLSIWSQSMLSRHIGLLCISWNNKKCFWYYWCTVQTWRLNAQYLVLLLHVSTTKRGHRQGATLFENIMQRGTWLVSRKCNMIRTCIIFRYKIHGYYMSRDSNALLVF